jgi:hypothetical protein
MVQDGGENNTSVNELMPKETFERRFSFVEDDTLKKNIAIAFEYIVFLINAAGKENHKRLIRSSLYKDATVYTGIIVEACLCYVLIKYLSANKLQKTKVLTSKWKEESQGKIYEFNKKKRIRYVIEHINCEDIKASSNFIEINRACLRGKILSKKEFAIAEEIRISRNRIHVSGLKEIDNLYSKEQLDAIFDKANKIIRKVEKKLVKI